MSLQFILGCFQFRQADLVSEGDANDAKRVIILLEVFLKFIECLAGYCILGALHILARLIIN